MSRIICKPDNKLNQVIAVAGDSQLGDVLTVELDDKDHFLRLLKKLKEYYPKVVFTGETFTTGGRLWSYIHIKIEKSYTNESHQ